MVRYIRSRIAEHPDLKDTLISNKMPARDIPNKAVIITNSPANQKKLSFDDLIESNVSSRVSLARTVEGPSTSIEWAMDNPAIVRGDMVADGYYFTKILTVPTVNSSGSYSINPVAKIQDTFEGSESSKVLTNPPLEGKMTVYTTHLGSYHRHLLSPVHYVYDSSTNEVVLAKALPNETVIIEYFATQPTLGPFEFKKNSIDITSLPGVSVAFGERVYLGDQQVLNINNPDNSPSRVDIYGGFYEISLDITVRAQDPGDQERLADYVSVWIWEKRKELEESNIIISDMGLGGESTDSEVEVSSVPFFEASLSLSITTYWEMRKPLLFEWKQLEIYDISDDDGTLSDAAAADISRTTIAVLDLVDEGGGDFFIPDNRTRLISPGFLAI